MLERLRGSLPLGRTGQAIAIAVAAGLLLGFVLVPRAPAPGEGAPLPNVTLLGRQLGLGDGAGQEALERVRRYASQRFFLELGDGKRREYYLGQLGAEIDKVRLAALVQSARDRTSAL